MTEDIVTGLFETNMSGAFLQAAYTWMILDFFGVNCVYLYSLTAAFFKIVPFTTPLIVIIIAAVQLLY